MATDWVKWPWWWVGGWLVVKLFLNQRHSRPAIRYRSRLLPIVHSSWDSDNSGQTLCSRSFKFSRCSSDGQPIESHNTSTTLNGHEWFFQQQPFNNGTKDNVVAGDVVNSGCPTSLSNIALHIYLSTNHRRTLWNRSFSGYYHRLIKVP